jgi:hypothetical protein
MIRLYATMCERLRIEEPLTDDNVEALLEEIRRAHDAHSGSRNSRRIFGNLRRYVISKGPQP